MAEHTEQMPSAWRVVILDHAVDRYANATDALVRFALIGVKAAVDAALAEHMPPHDGWVYRLRDTMLRNVVLNLDAAWQTDALEWMSESRRFSDWKELTYADLRKPSMSPDRASQVAAKERGIGFDCLPEFDTLCEMHRVANVVRHGYGKSLDVLWAEHGGLWRGERPHHYPRPWYLEPGEPVADFEITEDDVTRYAGAVGRLWRRISRSALDENREAE